MPTTLFANPISDLALGDPFVLRHAGRFYMYGTAEEPAAPSERCAIPAFVSDDLIAWTSLGRVLETDQPQSDHWAPEVLAWNGKFHMVYSFGDVENVGHALWLAVADRPEGPFRPVKRLSDVSEKFSIDGSWLLDDDGSLYLYRCLDFVDGDPPHGTGIVVQPMADFATPSGPPQVVLRAFAPWQLFEANRVMPLYGGRTFREWTTIEGPSPVKRNGRYYCGYSGGNYGRAYGTGEVVADRPLGPYRDPRGAHGPLIQTMPGLVEGPGHFSVVTSNLVDDWVVLHGRLPGEGRRRVWLCPAHWGDQGVELGRLQRDLQPAPRLPDVRWRTGMPALSSVDVGPHWVAEITGHANIGVELNSVGDGSPVRVTLDATHVRVLRNEQPASAPVPQQGTTRFDASASHTLRLSVAGGLLGVRVDGVLVLDRVPVGRFSRVDFDPAVESFELTYVG